MTSNILDNDKVVVVGSPAWHKLGITFDHPVTAVEAEKAMGGSFVLYKKQVGVMFDDHFVAVPNSFAIVRGHTNKDQRERVFGFATDHYHLVQPSEIIAKFDEKVGVGIETLGFIGNGEKMFLCWKLPSFEVVAGDEINLYGQTMIGFDKVFSSRLNIGTVRVVCENTFAMALWEEAEEKKKNRGRGTIYTSKHSNSRLLYELGEWMACIQENAEAQTGLLKSLFGKLHATPIKHEKQAEDLILTAYPHPAPIPAVYPFALRREKEEKNEMEEERLGKMRTGIYELFTGSQGIAIEPTYWGLFNSATQYFNHVMPSKKDTAYSIVWGNRNSHMNHFAEVLRDDMAGK